VISIGRQVLIGLPLQVHWVNAGHAAPTALTGSRQVASTQLLHASAPLVFTAPKHATMSRCDGSVEAIVVGGVALGPTAVEEAAVGVAGPGAGSEPQARIELTTKERKIEARFFTGGSSREHTEFRRVGASARRRVGTSTFRRGRNG
jgi:hypothetical protein